MEHTYLIISDIHGDLAGAELARDAFHRHQADYILLLGDLLYHGPRNDIPPHYAPKQVIPILNELAPYIIAVQGNCEADVDQKVLTFPCMASYNIIPYGSRRLFMTHGHIYGPDHLPYLNPGDVLLSGHTHIYTAEKEKGIFLCNPGSVSIPKGGNPPAYGLIQDDTFSVHTADGKAIASICFD
jgi:putative phosphoesterase